MHLRVLLCSVWGSEPLSLFCPVKSCHPGSVSCAGGRCVRKSPPIIQCYLTSYHKLNNKTRLSVGPWWSSMAECLPSMWRPWVPSLEPRKPVHICHREVAMGWDLRTPSWVLCWGLRLPSGCWPGPGATCSTGSSSRLLWFLARSLFSQPWRSWCWLPQGRQETLLLESSCIRDHGSDRPPTLPSHCVLGPSTLTDTRQSLPACEPLCALEMPSVLCRENTCK